MRAWLMLALLLLTIAASAPHRAPIAVELENASQYEITELRLHEDPDYADANNILLAPFRVGDTLEVELDRERFITFFREKYERGPLLAFTTARAIDQKSAPKYRVTIFDESFRVEGIGTIGEATGCGCSTITVGK